MSKIGTTGPCPRRPCTGADLSTPTCATYSGSCRPSWSPGLGRAERLRQPRDCLGPWFVSTVPVKRSRSTDPDAALAAIEEPVLLDEWQEVPGVLGAVKRAVDDDSRPGRFILTGSVRADFQQATWPGTGRVVRVPMYGMTVGELQGHVSVGSFLDRFAAASHWRSRRVVLTFKATSSSR
jgi:hypothetical protein